MAIRVLDERHRKAAEELLRGTTKARVCQLLEISRPTLYEWMRDPLWQEYYAQLLADLEAARHQRLLPLIDLNTQGLQEGLQRMLAALQDPTRPVDPRDLKVLAETFRLLSDQDRLAGGQPTSIRESRTREAKPDEELLKRLDKLATGTGAPLGTDPATPRKH